MGPVVIGGDNLPSPVGIGLTDPLAPPVPASLGYKQQSMVTRSLFYEGHLFPKRFLMAQTRDSILERAVHCRSSQAGHKSCCHV